MDDIELLKKTIFFKDLTQGELLKIHLLAEHVKFGSGQEILKEGTACDALYIIKKGNVNVMKGGLHLETLGIGDPVGEVAFIDKGPRSATLIADAGVEMLRLPAEAFEKIMSMDRDLAIKVYKSILFVLCQRLRDANDALKATPDYRKHISRL